MTKLREMERMAERLGAEIVHFTTASVVFGEGEDGRVAVVVAGGQVACYATNDDYVHKMDREPAQRLQAPSFMTALKMGLDYVTGTLKLEEAEQCQGQGGS